MGPPGGGKGTLSSRLVSEYDLKHFSSGDALRGHISDDTFLGQKAKGFMDAGELVPDDLMVDMVLSSVGNLDRRTNRWLLDGFPRNVAQAGALDEKFDLDLVINLDIPHEEIVERLRHRLVHVASGRSYHALWNPPRVEGKDDETGEDLIIRDDDKPERVRERLRVYDENTRPVLDYYLEKGKAMSFAGTESDVIWPQMMEYINAWIEKRG